MNEKSVLVIDTPVCCLDCPLMTVRDHFAYCRYTLETTSYDSVLKGRLDNCPLKPLPKYLGFEETETETKDIPSGFYDETIDGWNWCLDEILGENDESNISD